MKQAAARVPTRADYVSTPVNCIAQSGVIRLTRLAKQAPDEGVRAQGRNEQAIKLLPAARRASRLAVTRLAFILFRSSSVPE
jgi:hypothetical protein